MQTAASQAQPRPSLYEEMVNAVRFLAIDAVEAANSGHPGMPMGMADVATVLFTKFLNFDPKHPKWADRDRFVLSAGHGSMLLYALLHLTGYEEFTIDELKRFRQFGAKTAGHPEYGHAEGIETTTGPLGQGFGNAVGMALAEAMMAARFGDVVNHYTYVISGDGDLMEGISHEAASLAGHWKLGKLIVLFDDNSICIDGSTDMSCSDDTPGRFRSYGWHVQSIDGHDAAAVEAAIKAAKASDQPSLIACRTTIAYGAPTKAGSEKSHGSPLGKTEIEGTRLKLNWPHAPFEIPAHVADAWREAGSRGNATYKDWAQRLKKLPKAQQQEFERVVEGNLPFMWPEAISELKQQFAKDRPTYATRKSSQIVLEALTQQIPEMIGGSADLTGSVGTLTKSLTPVTRNDFAGRYIHYGVREHGMAAIMNGMALHGGFIPYSGTFLVFADYCRPSIRLSALMNQRVVYVMTHDSIGLGEDGPTHQPVEHLASLRCIPNLNVFRPADATEAAECWALALASKERPTVMVLTRQDLPTVRTEYTMENMCGRGGYILAEATKDAPKVSLLATGSEVHIAMQARGLLEAQGVPTRVVSIPSFELFEAQGEGYRTHVLGESALRVGIEAASPFGWDRYLGKYGMFVGVRTFGASGRYQDLYKHFGITPEAICEAVLERL